MATNLQKPQALNPAKIKAHTVCYHKLLCVELMMTFVVETSTDILIVSCYTITKNTAKIILHMVMKTSMTSTHSLFVSQCSISEFPAPACYNCLLE